MEDPDVAGRIRIKCILKKWDWDVRVEMVWQGQGQCLELEKAVINRWEPQNSGNF